MANRKAWEEIKCGTSAQAQILSQSYEICTNVPVVKEQLIQISSAEKKRSIPNTHKKRNSKRVSVKIKNFKP